MHVIEEKMKEEKVLYNSGSVECQGFMVSDPTVATKRPGIVIAHAWRGLDDFAREKARQLAKLGYIAFASDLYGSGLHVQTDEEASSAMTPLFLDRNILRERIVAAYETLRKNPFVDKSKIGAIGFCFGGATVIELLRSGVELKGVVAFHALLGNSLGDKRAKMAPNAAHLKGSLLILHGYEDPSVSAEDIAHIEKEFTEAKVDWQINLYGQTVHAFTNPQANDPAKGLVYNSRTAKRAWQNMENFFNEVFL